MPGRLRLRAAASALALAVAAPAACSASDADDAAGSQLDRAPTSEPTTATTAAAGTTSTSTAPAPPTTAAPVDVWTLRPPAPAADPVTLAEQVVTAEEAIRDDARTDVDVARAALAQQVAYRQLGTHPEWDAEVRARVPEALRAVVERNVAARRELRAMHTKLSPTLPAWRIVVPAPHAELLASYHEAEARFGIPWRFLAAINLVETATGRIRGTSVAGAQGPMQFMPATWAAYGDGGDVEDDHDAILGAGRYLAANGGATDIDHALYRYNHSQHYVRAVHLYADLIGEHPRAALGYYHWGVWYLTDQGEEYLPVGYEEPAPVPVAEYRARPGRG